MKNFKDSYEIDGFMADEHIVDFNEDRVYDYLSERFKDDPIVFVLDKDVVPDGYSRLGVLDYDSGKFQIGSDQVGPVRYEIRPDYTPLDIMFANFDRFEGGNMCPYDYVPVANPIIPTNKLYDCDESKVIDTMMIEKGFKILDPTPGQSAMCDESNSALYSDDLEGKYFDRYSLHSESVLSQSKKATVVSLQFNPFHPRSAKMIQQIKWENTFAVSGTYKYRSKIYRFDYDIRSTLFRYHADIWMGKLGLDIKFHYHYQSFDMVCNRRFFDDYVLPRNYGIARNYNGVFLEPMFTNREPPDDYSIIGPWKGDISFGGGRDKFYCPYLTPLVQIRDFGGTDKFAMVRRFRVFPDEVYDMENDVRMKRLKGRVYNRDYFFRRRGGFSVLYRRDKTGEFDFYEANFRILSEPHNNYASLISHPRTMSILPFVADALKGHKDQLVAGDKWGDMSNESAYSLKMVSLENLEIYDEPLLDLQFTTSDDFVDSRTVARKTKKEKKRKESRPRLTEDEKIELAIKSHVRGASFMNQHYTGKSYDFPGPRK